MESDRSSATLARMEMPDNKWKSPMMKIVRHSKDSKKTLGAPRAAFLDTEIEVVIFRTFAQENQQLRH